MINPNRWTGNLITPELCALSAEQWRERLNKLAEPTRSAVASIVFWDYADRSKTPSVFRDVFDAWLRKGIDVRIEDDEMRRGLARIGYRAEVINLRVPVTVYVRKNRVGRPSTGRHYKTSRRVMAA